MKNNKGFIETVLLVGASLALVAIGYIFYQTKPPKDNFAGTVLKSFQVGSSPQNGYYLQTDGTNSSWQPVVGGGSGGGTWSTTTSTHTGRLINYPNNVTDIPCIGGTATSTCEVFFDPNIESYRIGISNTASTTILGNLFIPSKSQGFAYLGSNSLLSTVASSSILLQDLGGAVTDAQVPDTITINTAGTATALAANGGNCSAGNAPLGVDASGAVESCFDVWTEAENTSAAYAAQATTITIAGTANQITSSAGAQSLAANRTWTLSIPSQFNIQQASTTLLSANQAWFGGTATTSIDNAGKITFPYSSSTIYSSFAHASTTTFTLGGVTGSAWSTFCTSITGSADLCDGSDASGAGGSSAYEIATTSDIALSQLAYIAKVSGRTTLASVATSSVTINAPLTSAGTPGYVVGGSGWTLDVDDIGAADLAAADFGSFTCNGTTCTVDNDAIALATQTTGNYVATLSSPNSTLTVANSGSENAAVTADLNLANANTWTAKQNFFGAASSTLFSANWLKVGATASTTIDTAGNVSLPAAGTLTIPALTSALLQTDANGLLAEYSGTSCTNQFTRSLSALGIATCASVATTDISGGSTNTVLQTNGADIVAWAKLDLANQVTGTLPIANGGTATTTGRYGGIYFYGGDVFRQASTTGLLDYDPTRQLFTTKYSSSTAYASFNVASTTFLRVGLADGCLNVTSGLVGSTGSACGSGAGGSDPFTHTLFGGIAGGNFFSATTSMMAISTSSAPVNISALTVASSTASQLSLSAGAGLAQWTMRNAGGNLYFSTTTVAGTATTSTAALTLQGSGVPSLVIGTSTPTSSYNGSMFLGTNTANGTTTIFMGKIQIDGYTTGGTRNCVMWNGTAWTSVSGACTP